MKKTTTMRDIGARLGVSTVTISKALSGKPGVSDSVREKIIETAREMGYHYAASTQENREGALIGILIADRFFSAPSFYCDNYAYGPDARPITTYAVDQQRMAQVTVRRLQTRIREGIEGPLRTVVGGWLVERDSVWDLRTGRRCGSEEKSR